MDLVDYYERELHQLADQMHHGLTQSAAGARLWLNCWQPVADPQELEQAVAAVARALDETLVEARALAITLRPLADPRARFADCLADLMADLQTRRQEPVTWSCDGVEPAWPWPQRAAMARLLRHALRVIEQDHWMDLELAVRMGPTAVNIAVATRPTTRDPVPWPHRFREQAAPLLAWLSARLEVSSTPPDESSESSAGIILSVASPDGPP